MASSYTDNDSDYSNNGFDSDEAEYDNQIEDNSEYDDQGDTSHSLNPEHFDYELMKKESAERFITRTAEKLCEKVNHLQSTEPNLSPTHAKIVLQEQNWNIEDSVMYYRQNIDRFVSIQSPKRDNVECSVCLQTAVKAMGISCGHEICSDCWKMHVISRHVISRIRAGESTMIQCMENGCKSIVPGDFVSNMITDSKVLAEYQRKCLNDHVNCHPQLRFCPGLNCHVIVYASAPMNNKAHRVHCTECENTFCFTCGLEYHSPTDCSEFQKWLMESNDESESAYYIETHTKKCPKCSSNIEKNKGCNQTTCTICKHAFCWLCLKDWTLHQSSSSACNQYKDGEARSHDKPASNKHFFYYKRYMNHRESMKQDDQGIKDYIQQKMHKYKSSSSIDWEFLLEAGDILNKCRYTLMHSYPKAYFLEDGIQKQLVEQRQYQLEQQVDNLSHAIKQAEVTDRGYLQRLMCAAKEGRINLL